MLTSRIRLVRTGLWKLWNETGFRPGLCQDSREEWIGVAKRVHGSHHIYDKERISVRISVPIHGNKLLKAGLQGHLAKLAGLKAEDFNLRGNSSKQDGHSGKT